MGDPAPCTPAQLARRGLNVVLISRSLSKLEQEAKEIGESQGLPGAGQGWRPAGPVFRLWPAEGLAFSLTPCQSGCMAGRLESSRLTSPGAWRSMRTSRQDCRTWT